MARGGLFTGFEHYRISSEADKQAALLDALVAVDTNVLLDLYRYNRATAEDLLTVLEAMRDRIFVPHQVVHEFWRNRQSVIGGLGSATKDARSALATNSRSTRDAIEGWAKRTAMDKSALNGLLYETTKFFDDLQEKLAGEPSTANTDPAIGKDWLLTRLESLLAGAVGPSLPDAEWQSAVVEGRRRFDNSEPPGYKENEKQKSGLPEGVSGDYLVWKQLLVEGAAAKKDLVLILADVKEDWWWRDKSLVIGPRRELVAEYLKETGCQLFFFTPSDLLQHSATLGVGTSAESVDDIERVQRDDAVAEPHGGRRARSVHVIVDNDLIEPGEDLELNLRGILNVSLVEQVEAWVSEYPQRGRAQWTADRIRPLLWAADPDDAPSWSPTSLAKHIISEATGVAEPRTIAGPDVWIYNDQHLYGIASDFLGEAE
ncbi:PIN-like domain-containing protein [Nocardia salmonicida]|uniref:PIN-like domain-containing protein n=1 Tax=Nocardia salmonicida TaxID=53431 RepID=UPI0037AE4950